jgi:hypothetical protein
MARITVLRDRHALGMADTGQVEAAELADALEREWPVDAHMVAYEPRTAPTDDGRRIVVRLLMHESDDGRPAVYDVLEHLDVPCVRMVAIVGDLDAHDLRGAALAAWRAEQLPRLEAAGLAYYETRGGYRLLAELAEPVEIASPADAATWTDLYLGWCAYAHEAWGLDLDRACKDWTREFRLPNVVRDGKPVRAVVLGSLGPYDPIGAGHYRAHGGKASTPRAANDGAHADDAHLARAHALAARLPPSVEGHDGDTAHMIAASELATALRGDADAIERVLLETFNPRCLPPWSASRVRREARRAADRYARDEAKLRGVSAALERARAAREDADDTSWAHAADANAAPVLLRARDGGAILLWEGDDRGLRPIAKDVLRARVRELGLEALVPLSEGKRARSASAILDDATTYERTRYDFSRTLTTYEAAGEGTVTIGFAPRGPAPRYDADADAWLRALGGPAYDRLAVWLASCAQRHIARLAATLVIVGPPDVGKSLVAVSAARTWDAAPPPMTLVVRQFNGQMLECPVMCDEEAQLFGSKALSTKAFRDLAQATSRGVEKKHQERVQLVGAQRYVVPCNELGDIRFADLGGGDVVQALADRLLVIDVGARADACRAALARLRPAGEYTVDVDRIAAHVAWLGETIALPVERFAGAGGEATTTAAVLRGHVREYEELFDDLETWLEGPPKDGPWYAREGLLFVSRRDLAMALEQRGRGWDLPRVTRALEPFARGAVRIREGGRGARQFRVWALDADALAGAGACEADAIAKRLGAPA